MKHEARLKSTYVHNWQQRIHAFQTSNKAFLNVKVWAQLAFFRTWFTFMLPRTALSQKENWMSSYEFLPLITHFRRDLRRPEKTHVKFQQSAHRTQVIYFLLKENLRLHEIWLLKMLSWIQSLICSLADGLLHQSVTDRRTLNQTSSLFFYFSHVSCHLLS